MHWRCFTPFTSLTVCSGSRWFLFTLCWLHGQVLAHRSSLLEDFFSSTSSSSPPFILDRGVRRNFHSDCTFNEVYFEFRGVVRLKWMKFYSRTCRMCWQYIHKKDVISSSRVGSLISRSCPDNLDVICRVEQSMTVEWNCMETWAGKF